MNSYAYYNGVFAPTDEIKIPLSDRSVFFGDGVYDAAVGVGGGVYRFHEHFLRFAKNAKRTRIHHSLTEGELLGIIKRLILISAYESYFVYFQLTANGKERRHERFSSAQANLLVTVKPWSFPKGLKKITLCTAPDERHGICHIKSLNLLASVMAASSAAERGFDECAFIHANKLTECAHSNIFLVKSGEIATPPISHRVLDGITRATVIRLLTERKIPIKIKELSYEDLNDADGAFITSTSRLCQSVEKINARKISENSRLVADVWQMLSEDYLHKLQN